MRFDVGLVCTRLVFVPKSDRMSSLWYMNVRDSEVCCLQFLGMYMVLFRRRSVCRLTDAIFRPREQKWDNGAL